jgi:superfamily II RNA helicase
MARNRGDNKGPRRPRPERARRYKRDGDGGSSAKYTEHAQTPAQARAASDLLRGIGVPPRSEFKPDDFQLEALEAIEHEDVLVTAPTGSGKTWIASEEIRRLLDQDKRAWYTTPLKALTNSKYIEFSNMFGSANVGILTGDRKENTEAPLIVGTTEIYRNQLFDALRSGEQVRTDFVILDEAHYLSDEDRGHVWEEAIILTTAENSSSAVVGDCRPCGRIRTLDRRGPRYKGSRHQPRRFASGRAAGRVPFE